MADASDRFKRHPGLDLTRAPLSAGWWMRAALLAVLIGLAAIGLFRSAPLERLKPIAPLFDDEAQTIGAATSTQEPLAADTLKTIQSPLLKANAVHEHARLTTVTLAPKETLSDAVMRAGFSAQDSFAALSALDAVVPVKRVRPGVVLTLTDHMAAPGRLSQLSMKADFGSLARVWRNVDGRYEAESVALETTTRQRVVKGAIDASLYLSAEALGVPAGTIVELIRALSYRVDFQREIRAGDSFALIYSVSQAADGASQASSPDYAALDLGDRVEQLYRFTHPKTGRADYYDQKGESMRRLLMRTPVDGARLTSGFGKRKHPVLGYVRSHPGVDFGAPTGTPIYAAGDGIVERANRYGSYGNYVRIRHARGFKTAYAHLSRFSRGMKKGKRVRQGEVIGYVGATGRVTGPHLHYEVYKGGTRVNPTRLDLPTGEVLSGQALKDYKAHMAVIDARLEETEAR